MKHTCRSFLIAMFLIVSSLLLSGIRGASAQVAGDDIVRVVLFFSPTCGHCEKVITETLTPLKQQYGDSLLILGIDISKAQGAQVYQTAINAMNISDDRLGVPTLMVADQVLVGSMEIPELLPGLITQLLGNGGADWPAIPGFAELLAQVLATPTQTPVPTSAPTVEPTFTPEPTAVPTQPPPTPTPTEVPPYLLSFESTQDFLTNFQNDQLTNSIAVVVLAAMVITAVVMPFTIARPLIVPRHIWINWLFPLLMLAGLVLAAYMAYVEVQGVAALSWPIGDCNLVQKSGFTRIGGVLSVAVFSLAGYIALLVAWLVSRVKLSWLSRLAASIIIVLTMFGTLFTILLTFLEPFVIGATCLWCVVSAVLITILFGLSIPYYWSVRRA